MKAIVRHKHGSPGVLALQDGDKPQPRHGEVQHADTENAPASSQRCGIREKAAQGKSVITV